MIPPIVTAARQYLGTPWRHLGRTDRGVDCIGLVLLAAAEIGVVIPDPAPYEREPQGTRLLQGIAQYASRVGAHQPGDILVFRSGLYAGHIGIASEHPTYGKPAVIHAFARHGRAVCEQVLASLLQDTRAATLMAAFRLPPGG